MDDVKWFVGLLLIFGIMWIGGRTKSKERPPETATSTAKTQVSAPASQNEQKGSSAQTANQNTFRNPPIGTVISESTIPRERDLNISPLQGALSIVSVVHGNSAEKEYVTIQASSRNKNDINITGLTIRSAVSLNGHKIGNGLALYFPQTSGDGDPIMLRPGGRALILSGRSQLGAIPKSGGFQLNLCTGFFEQGLNFYPSLPLECPSPKDEPLPIAPNTLSETCYDYLAKIKRCTVPSSVPATLSTDGNCQAHIFNRINYNQCVVDNKDSPGFFRGEWRVYFGRSSKLWRDRHDIVELVDQERRIIDTRGY